MVMMVMMMVMMVTVVVMMMVVVVMTMLAPYKHMLSSKLPSQATHPYLLRSFRPLERGINASAPDLLLCCSLYGSLWCVCVCVCVCVR